MNIQIAPKRTPAEAALVAAFADRLAQLPGDAAVAMRRDDAMEILKQGLPTRRVEAWHYTDLRRLLATVPDHDPTAHARRLAPLVETATVLPVLNGQAADIRSIDGVSISRIEAKLVEGSFARALLTRGPDDAVGALNIAFVNDGYFLDISAGAAPAAPIEVQNVHAGGQVHTRLAVRVGERARVTIVERQSGEGTALVSSVSNLTVAKGAEVIWVILQEQPTDATHLGQFNAELGEESRLTLMIVNSGSRLLRQEVRVGATARGSDFKLRCVNMMAGDTHADVTLDLAHSAPATTSTEIVRNVVLDRARGVFQGRISVAPEAQKTDARMACNTLLLSDEAEFSVKPELEIFADDVQCGHGATVAEIDRSHLFYLMARGVPEKVARGLLVKAFLAEIVEDMDHEPLVVALEARLDAWFAAHG